MSAQGRALMQCTCGSSRFKVAMINVVKCMDCERNQEIDPTIRWVGPSVMDELWDTYSEDTMNTLLKLQEAGHGPR
jgi:hypothetical protein